MTDNELKFHDPETGFYTDKDGDLWKLVSGRWYLIGSESTFGAREMEALAPFTPVTIVPTETWDRLRVLDPEDTRDRVDANGVTWISAAGGWLPVARSATLRCVMSLENIPGPLRFADEVSDDA